MSLFATSILAVLAAAALDVIANLLLARSEGFRRRLWGLSALVMVALAFSALSIAVRGMDLAVAYAMWGGFGILGTSLGGWFFFGQKLKPIAWLGIVLLACGLAVLHTS